MTSNEPTLTILSQPAKGSITLMPDDNFRWQAQKIIWESYRDIGEAIACPVLGRLKKQSLNDNSQKIDTAELKLLAKLVEMGLSYVPNQYCSAKGILHELSGARLMGEMPTEKTSKLSYINEKIEEAVLREAN